eukprot:SAG11_NODE_9739_length_884_cov_1.096815_1_plen_109_part_10
MQEEWEGYEWLAKQAVLSELASVTPAQAAGETLWPLCTFMPGADRLYRAVLRLESCALGMRCGAARFAEEFQPWGEGKDAAADLLRNMLRLAPQNRLSARDALDHPYFT